MYCVTMTTGGTCSDVEGKSSTEGGGSAEEVAGLAAAAELDGKAVLLELGPEGSATLPEDAISEVVGVGKTVVYSVLVTTRRVEVVMVELLDVKTEELEYTSDDNSVELASVAEGDNCVTDTRLALTELVKELFGATVP